MPGFHSVAAEGLQQDLGIPFLETLMTGENELLMNGAAVIHLERDVAESDRRQCDVAGPWCILEERDLEGELSSLLIPTPSGCYWAEVLLEMPNQRGD